MQLWPDRAYLWTWWSARCRCTHWVRIQCLNSFINIDGYWRATSENCASHSNTNMRVQLIRMGFKNQDFWLEGSSKTVSKRALGWKGHHKPFPKGFFGWKGHRKPFTKGFLVERVSKKRFHKGLLVEVLCSRAGVTTGHLQEAHMHRPGWGARCEVILVTSNRTIANLLISWFLLAWAGLPV